LLQIVINGELNLLAGDRFLLRETADFLANAVDDHAAHSVRANQQIIILTLETRFAGHVARTQFSVAGFDLLLADFPYVTGSV
jgi:hypothetical protein